MKNKLDWFDDNWNWNVRPIQVRTSTFPYLPVAEEGKRSVLV